MIIFRKFCYRFAQAIQESQQQISKYSNPDSIPTKMVLKNITLSEQLSIQQLSILTDIDQKELIRTINQFSKQPVNYTKITKDLIEPILPLYNLSSYKENPITRPPIITIMGHVDHGKTTLLDRLRNSNIAEGEVGGITQKIGAFHVKVGDNQITFIDTPGHEAFSNMRQRGAEFTDMIILVVSAADGVQPQTKEVIQIASQLNIPIIVAINKIDVPNVNPEDVELELLECGLDLESQGGNIPVVHISAKNGKNIDLLLELIQFQGELLELKADPTVPAQGVVLEARQSELTEERGSTIIVQKGSLKINDIIVVGNQYGKVRVMRDDRANTMQIAGPSSAIEIIGLKEIPQSGSKFFVAKNELIAQLIVNKRKKEAEFKQLQNAEMIDGSFGKIKFQNKHEKRDVYGDTKHLIEKYKEIQNMLREEIESTEDPEIKEALVEKLRQHELFSSQMINLAPDTQVLKLVIKGQDFGTLETLIKLVNQLKEKENAEILILSSGVGDVTQKDFKDAQLFGATIVTLNSNVPNDIIRQAQQDKIDIVQHQIIYHLIDDLKTLVTAPRNAKVSIIGTAKVQNVFDVKLKGQSRKIYGLTVTHGILNKKCRVRLLRGGKVVAADLEIANLKHFKEEVDRIESGKDCGLSIISNVEVKVGDEFECYKS
ncbi:unnamed protein product (macronuclear) [Paramecium tetraurelia]|uniref:Translation initiation factor IF-2, mitochondrial n=1 Tax=Paramecium tetraurelia TaxID=5888 RepID=A0BPT3_PARTE|nr:uncharacterized protein GSPATT00005300001 [Paramecium tetraurelia]CAK60550.1 unnamed protein product [Paramecium tetraurelia]|eukprot:XP_001427948.1 hypothetical protein (macronuclear) [Paramecium tetraurelia strain d4-2]